MRAREWEGNVVSAAETPSKKASVAVVMAARNVERFVGEAIDSVLGQTMEDLELVVVVDSSIDTTAELARSRMTDPRIQVVERKCGGVSAARNLGLSMVRAPLVVFLDADDVLEDEALGRYRDALDAEPAAVAVVAGHIKIDERGAPIAGEDVADRPGFEAGPALVALLRRNTIVNGGAIAMRSDVVRRVGGFDVTLDQGEDWELWCRVACEGPFASLGRWPALHYRQRRTSATAARIQLDLDTDEPAIEKIYALGRERSGLPENELAKLRRTASISSFWARVRIALYHRDPKRLAVLAAQGLWRYPDSLFKGFLLRFLWRKSLAVLGRVFAPGAVRIAGR